MSLAPGAALAAILTVFALLAGEEEAPDRVPTWHRVACFVLLSTAFAGVLGPFLWSVCEPR